MDLIDLAQQIAEMRGEYRAGRTETADALERIEGRLSEIPALCYDHRAKCMADREQAEAKMLGRVGVLESAAQPTTVRQAWAWAQYCATVGAGAALTGYALVELGRKMQLFP